MSLGIRSRASFQTLLRLVGKGGVGIHAQQLLVKLHGFLPFAQQLAALAGLEQSPRLPCRVGVEDFHLEVGPQRGLIVLLVEIGLADHPLGHRGGFGLCAFRRVDYLLIGLPCALEIGLRRQTAANHVVGLVLLLEPGKSGLDLRRDGIRILPPLGLGHDLRPSQRNHRHPGLGRFGKFPRQPLQSLPGAVVVALPITGLGDPILCGQS